MSTSRLVFDAACPLCVAASRRLVRWGWIEEGQREAFQDLAPELQTRLIEAGFQNALAVVEGETIHLGMAGLRRVSETAPASWSARLLRWPPVGWLAEQGYRIVAPNRRILAPVRQSERAMCACEPTPSAADRGRLIVVSLLLSLGFACLVGALGGRPWLGLGGGAIAGLGALLLAGLPPGPRLERMTHAAWIVLLGASAALAAALVLWLVDLVIPLSGSARLAMAGSVFVFVAGASTLRRRALARR